MTNEMLELADEIDTCIRLRIYDVGLSHDEKASIAAALRSTAAQADVRDLEQVFVDACDEAGCAHDNEALLQAIADLKRRALPAQGELVRDQLVNALSAIEQRANESGTGEMGLLDTVHAMARIARVALALVKP